MPPLKKFSGEEICWLLGKQGFQPKRQKGSHHIMQKRSNGGSITVPVPLHKELKPGTLSSIIRQSKLPREIFEEH
jgi:predicted RNA binding protein YcfA (HicA-like mRNA interferase family)